VGNVTSFILKGMSKDNFFYGVRAVDNEGNRSPVTYPKPMTRNQTPERPSASSNP
jgi:beta-N-acetylglucosaminidase